MMLLIRRAVVLVHCDLSVRVRIYDEDRPVRGSVEAVAVVNATAALALVVMGGKRVGSHVCGEGFSAYQDDSEP